MTMSPQDRESWIAKLRQRIEEQADLLFSFEQSKQTETKVYKETLASYLKNVKMYEEATNRHNVLLQQEGTRVS